MAEAGVMRGLTLYQPRATLIACSFKRVETRSWGTSWRGPLAVHAARKWDDDVREDVRRAEADCKRCWGTQFYRPECREAGNIPWGRTLGCIVAVVNLVDCRLMPEAPDAQEALFGSFGEGRWGWVLDPASLRPLLSPVPCKGARGLWPVPPDVLALVEAAPARAG